MVASLPQGTQYTLFPSYTRKVGDHYVVTVRGWMWCPGSMSRKNRLVLSLAKQVTRSNDDSALVAVDRLAHDPSLTQDATSVSEDDSDVASISTSGSGTSVASSASPQLKDSDARLRARLASFLARSIPNAGLAIVVGADSLEHQELRQVSVVTDPNGHFSAELEVKYKPSVVLVTSKIDETVCAFQEIHLVQYDGYGIISDIDDTVKLTGVIGDKRELMRRLLLGEVQSWEIKPVIQWFNEIQTQLNATFHYVSNSPWQLFATIQEYFHLLQLPPGSFHLKQYTGNIISSLMEPSSSRKKTSLSRILNDFPNKQFICVGDSGEHDFEAYVDLAVTYPGQVKCIYIRVVDDSLSDVDDDNILKEMKRVLKEWKAKQNLTKKQPVFEDHLAEPKQSSQNASSVDLIDLSEPLTVPKPNRKPPPAIPKKPTALKGSSIRAPPLPERRTVNGAQTDTSLLHEQISQRQGANPPPLPKRKTSPAEFDSNIDEQMNLLRIHDIDSYYELEEYDKKGGMWLQRLTRLMEALDDAGVDIAFFEDHDNKFFKDTLHFLTGKN